MSPDNASVYAVGDDDAVVRFDRDLSTGALTGRGCIADAPDLLGCGASAPALNAAREVVVSPDGRSVYMTSFGDAAITRFDRESGVVTPPPPNPPSNAVSLRTNRFTCTGACKKVKVKVDVDGPGKVKFCNAPAGVNEPCGIGGSGPTGPRLDRASKPKAVESKSVDVTAAGTVTTSLKLTKKARKTLSKKGKLSFTLQVDFTPTGGTTNSDRQKLKVKQKD